MGGGGEGSLDKSPVRKGSYLQEARTPVRRQDGFKSRKMPQLDNTLCGPHSGTTYSEKGQIVDERTEGRIREGRLEEVELAVGFVGSEAGGRRQKAVLDRKNVRNKSLERRMSLVFL